MGTLRSLCVGLVLAACGEKGSHPPDAAPMRDLVATLPATLSPDIDFLFVVDDSNSMATKQLALANNFPVFINRLQSLPGGLPNLHIGVVTTDVGTKGSAVATPGPAIGQVGNGGCSGLGKAGNLQTFGAPITGAFLSDVKATDGSRVRNYTGDLATVFGQMAKAGAGGCGFEQPLHAMRRALDNNPANAGFLRPSAALAVVFLGDEDDCTATDPMLFTSDTTTLGPLASFRCTRFGVTCTTGGATPDAMNTVGTKAGCAANATSTLLDDITPYATFLRGLKTDPSRVLVGGILGPADPFSIELAAPPGGGTPVPTLAHSCAFTGANGLEVADPAARLAQFQAQFPDRAVATTICQSDLSVALDTIASLSVQAIGTPCLSKIVTDTDPMMPGTQADCVVTARSGAEMSDVPPCPAAGPCWRIQTGDFATCPSLDGSKLVIEGAAGFSPDTVFEARCVTDPVKPPPPDALH